MILDQFNWLERLNVIVIAAGIAEGMQVRLNARSALIFRGLVEMTGLGVRMKGQSETFQEWQDWENWS